jgi:hypothetical protein
VQRSGSTPCHTVFNIKTCIYFQAKKSSITARMTSQRNRMAWSGSRLDQVNLPQRSQRTLPADSPGPPAAVLWLYQF